MAVEGQFADNRMSVLQPSNCRVCGTFREGCCGGANGITQFNHMIARIGHISIAVSTQPSMASSSLASSKTNITMLDLLTTVKEWLTTTVWAELQSQRQKTTLISGQFNVSQSLHTQVVLIYSPASYHYSMTRVWTRCPKSNIHHAGVLQLNSSTQLQPRCRMIPLSIVAPDTREPYGFAPFWSWISLLDDRQILAADRLLVTGAVPRASVAVGTENPVILANWQIACVKLFAPVEFVKPFTCQVEKMN